MDADRVTAVAPDGLTIGAATPGIRREVAFDTTRATLMRAEFGPGGAEGTEVEEGGFLHVPAGLVHRDVYPLGEPQEIVLTIVGDRPLVVNVDGPDPAP